MLAVWRDWHLPALLRRAWRSGIVLAGVSAGAICWFEFGVTDSWSEPPRRSAVPGLFAGDLLSSLRRRAGAPTGSPEGSLRNGLSRRRSPLDDGAAAHFVGRKAGPHRQFPVERSWVPRAPKQVTIGRDSTSDD